jgi:hypothetical protein
MGILSNDVALQMINGLYNHDYVQKREEDNMVTRRLVERIQQEGPEDTWQQKIESVA